MSQRVGVRCSPRLCNHAPHPRYRGKPACNKGHGLVDPRKPIDCGTCLRMSGNRARAEARQLMEDAKPR